MQASCQNCEAYIAGAVYAWRACKGHVPQSCTWGGEVPGATPHDRVRTATHSVHHETHRTRQILLKPQTPGSCVPTRCMDANMAHAAWHCDTPRPHITHHSASDRTTAVRCAVLLSSCCFFACTHLTLGAVAAGTGLQPTTTQLSLQTHTHTRGHTRIEYMDTVQHATGKAKCCAAWA